MSSKYNHLTKEELVSLLIQRDSTRKLGLVWERNEIEHERVLNSDFVTLDLEESLSYGDAPFENLLIEGDNFDALRYLRIAYKGRVKCIYIDPPYNTGNRDFIYNDDFLDKEDEWKHSKWLEFMYKRLTLAKDLLSEDGVIFVSIGEEEYSHLSLLMDEVFTGMKVGTFVWRRRSGANDEKNWFISADHEYVLCFANPGFSFKGIGKDWSDAIDDGDKRGPWIDGPLNQGKDIKQRAEAFYPLYNPKTDVWYPCDPDSVWRFATIERNKTGKKIRTKYMEELVNEGRISWPAKEEVLVYNTEDEILEALANGTAPHNLRIYERIESYKSDVDAGANPRILQNIPPMDFWLGKKIGMGKPRLKRFTSEIKKTDKPISTWILPSSIKKMDLENIELDEVETFQVGHNTEGTTLLSRMIGNKDFDYPKPLSLVKALVNQSTDPHSGHIVLDFFGGSGTTGHAVLDLNSEDDGDRRFIIVSTTEATEKEPNKNVCRDITVKRLKAAIEGYSWRTSKGVKYVEGLGGSFAYFRACKIPMSSLHLEIKHDQIWYCLQQLHLETVAPYYNNKEYQNAESEFVSINYIPLLNQEIIKKLQNDIDIKHKNAIIYTWQPGILKQKISSEHVSIEGIPEYLLERFGGLN